MLTDAERLYVDSQPKAGRDGYLLLHQPLCLCGSVVLRSVFQFLFASLHRRAFALTQLPCQPPKTTTYFSKKLSFLSLASLLSLQFLTRSYFMAQSVVLCERYNIKKRTAVSRKPRSTKRDSPNPLPAVCDHPSLRIVSFRHHSVSRRHHTSSFVITCHDLSLHLPIKKFSYNHPMNTETIITEPITTPALCEMDRSRVVHISAQSNQSPVTCGQLWTLLDTCGHQKKDSFFIMNINDACFSPSSQTAVSAHSPRPFGRLWHELAPFGPIWPHFLSKTITAHNHPMNTETIITASFPETSVSLCPCGEFRHLFPPSISAFQVPRFGLICQFMTLTEQMTQLAEQAKAASRQLAKLTTAEKNACLLAMADASNKTAPPSKRPTPATWKPAPKPAFPAPCSTV